MQDYIGLVCDLDCNDLNSEIIFIFYKNEHQMVYEQTLRFVMAMFIIYQLLIEEN
jgi:hypothetical protein